MGLRSTRNETDFSLSIQQTFTTKSTRQNRFFIRKKRLDKKPGFFLTRGKTSRAGVPLGTKIINSVAFKPD
jgi:hypothetical protein